MLRTPTANETVGRWKLAGTKPEQTQRASEHALLIPLGPDGEYMKSGERHWESEEMTKEIRYRNKALREAAQQR